MAVFSLIGNLIKDKPKVPNLKTIDVQEQQKKAIQGNIDALPQLQTLGAKTQEALISQYKKGVEELFPGTEGIIKQGSENIAAGLRGELPKDVTDYISRRAAETAASTGTTGTQFANFRELRNLGLTSLARTQQSLDAAMRWVTTAYATTPTVDFSRFFITPEFQTQVAMSERDTRFNQQWLKSQVKAKYSDKSILGDAFIQFDRDIVNIGTSLIGMAAGGMGGGGSTPPPPQTPISPGLTNPPPTMGPGIPYQSTPPPQAFPNYSPGGTSPSIPSFG